MKFYRYEAVSYASGFSGFSSMRIELREFNLHKETPKGYWIGYGYYASDMLRGYSRWVSKTGLKRYAYPTKEEAMTNYIKRTEKRVKILRGQLRNTEDALKIALKMEVQHEA